MLVLAADKSAAFDATLAEWITAGVVLAGAIVAGKIAKAVLFRAIGKGDEEPLAVDVVGRIFTTLAVVAGVLTALSILNVHLGAIIGALGIGGLAVAFAAQSILANFLASVILQIRRPFKRGDQIRTNDCEGTVEDINFRTVILRTYNGQRTMVPCADVLSHPIVNHTALGRRRTTLEIGVSYDADLAKARNVLLKAVRSVEEVRERPEPEVWVKSFDDSAMTLAVRFWHAPDAQTLWRVRSAVAVAAKRALDEAAIAIPFPQRVLHFVDSRQNETDSEQAESSIR